MTWQAIAEPLAGRRGQEIRLRDAEGPLSYEAVMRLWRRDEAFCDFFSEILAAAPEVAFFWETPAVTRTSLSQDFTFVLADSPQLAVYSPDERAFADQFRAAGPDAEVAAFPNLGGDADLIVPCPRVAPESYSHLAIFSRTAPLPQQRAFWQLVGQRLEWRLGEAPLWLSTSGLGVAWLHARLDSQPKYYTHAPYCRLPPGATAPNA